MNDLDAILAVSARGMRAQGERLRVISENIANADTAPMAKGGKPYQRQVVTFENELDKASGMKLIKVAKIAPDTQSPFVTKYMPGHPAADEGGYVQMPNVNSLVEMMDMREAQRSYEATLGMFEQGRSMLMRTIDLLRS